MDGEVETAGNVRRSLQTEIAGAPGRRRLTPACRSRTIAGRPGGLRSPPPCASRRRGPSPATAPPRPPQPVHPAVPRLGRATPSPGGTRSGPGDAGRAPTPRAGRRAAAGHGGRGPTDRVRSRPGAARGGQALADQHLAAGNQGPQRPSLKGRDDHRGQLGQSHPLRQARRVAFPEAEQLVPAGGDRVEGRLGRAAIIGAGDALVLAQVEGENGVGGSRFRGCRLLRASLSGGEDNWGIGI